MNRNQRERHLRLTLKKLQLQSGLPVTVVALARSCNVSAALVHNRFPEVAAEVRRAKAGLPVVTGGKSQSAKITELRNRLKIAEAQIRNLASINETLMIQLALGPAQNG